jgi:hypothetical protein
MSVHKYTSWGRTRSPKNLAGDPGTAITVLTNTNTLKGITATSAGYNTENQRYLHVLIEETNDGSDTDADTVSIYGYCHAFQRWFEIPQSFEPDGTNTGVAVSAVEPANSSTAPVAHVPGSREYRVYQILGIDKVAFVGTNASRVNVFAACSTF